MDADAASIVYVRGDSAQGEEHPVPNPAWFPKGAKQQVWIVSANGGEPRLLGEGHAPAVSPDGKSVAYHCKGQLWSIRLDDPKAKPTSVAADARVGQAIFAGRPTARSLAFVSDRDDHSFIAVYTVATSAVAYLDPSTDLDTEPTWSPDSTRIAFLRIPPDKNALLFVPHRTALPWSIRVADVAAAKAAKSFAPPKAGQRLLAKPIRADQLHWTAGRSHCLSLGA